MVGVMEDGYRCSIHGKRVTLMEKDLHLVNKLRIRKLTKVVRYTSTPNASPEERLAAAQRAYDRTAVPEDNDIS